MAFEGYSAVQIVEHYFRGAELRRLYAEAGVGLHTSTG
jgi:peptidoglycan hydrolase-like amidase